MKRLRALLMTWPAAPRRLVCVRAVSADPAMAEQVRQAVDSLVGPHLELRLFSDRASAVDRVRRVHTVFLVDIEIGAEELTRLILVARSLRAPVVALGRKGQERAVACALDAGAADFLSAEDLTTPIVARVLRLALDRERLHHLALRTARDSARHEQRSRALLAALPKPALLIDALGRVAMANPASETLFGRPLAALQRAGLDGLGWADGSPLGGGGAGGVGGIGANGSCHGVACVRATLEDGVPRTTLAHLGLPEGRHCDLRLDVRALFENGPFRPSGAVVLLEDLDQRPTA